MRHSLGCARIAFWSLLILATLGIGSAHAQRPQSDQPGGKLQAIEDALKRIEARLDAPSASTTFCISQGRGVELGQKFHAEVKVEGEAGLGWPNVLDGKAVAKVAFPLIPVPIPVAIPTETSLAWAGGHGKNFDICIELPLKLSDEDQRELEDISNAMNDQANTSGRKGKFQRRAARIINFACRKVRGLFHCPLLANAAVDLQANAEDDTELELDRADTATENLLDGGIGAVAEGLQVFQDGNVRELLASLELPSNVRSFMEEPEGIFEGLPDLSQGVAGLGCDALQITAEMRSRQPRLDGLCRFLASQQDLSDEIVNAVAEIVKPLLALSTVSEAAADTKTRFCSSAIGQRRVFDRYCGR